MVMVSRSADERDMLPAGVECRHFSYEFATHEGKKGALQEITILTLILTANHRI